MGPSGATEYNSSSFTGEIGLRALSAYNTTLNDASVTLQLNVVLSFVNNGTHYVYWIQDVLLLDTSTNHASFFDNIWNLSAPGSQMESSGLSGAGTIYTSGALAWYAAGAFPFLPGNNVDLSLPSTIDLTVNGSLTSAGQPVVAFYYADGGSRELFDSVTFQFADQLSSDLGFVVDGFSGTPLGGIYYDAELVLCGPGSGASTQVSAANLTLALSYWNGHNYEEVQNASNFGSDTAETVSGVVDQGYYYTFDGSLFALLTAGSGGLGQLWSSSAIAVVDLHASTLPTGALAVNGARTSYLGGAAEVALGPGLYQFDVVAYGYVDDSLGLQSLTAGEILSLNAASYVAVNFTAEGLPRGTVFNVTLNGVTLRGPDPTITFLEPPGFYSYSLAPLSGYRTATYSGSLSVGGSPVSITILWIQVTYSVTVTSSGLAAGTLWGILIDGNVSTTTSSEVSLLLANGTYQLSIEDVPGYRADGYSFPLWVHGNATAVALNWSLMTYTILVTCQGLPRTASWEVDISGLSLNATAQHPAIPLPNVTFHEWA